MKKLNAGFVPVVLLVIIFVAVGGGLYYSAHKENKQSSEKVTKNTDISKCNTTDTSLPDYIQQKQKDLCISEIAYKNNDLNLCDTTINEEASGSCYTAFAMQRKDISICNKIRPNSLQFLGCISGVAREKQDVSLCDKLSDSPTGFSKFDCYANIARDKREPVNCNLIPQNRKDDIKRCSEENARRGFQ